MIRINLLPVRAAKKKESIRLQLTIAGLATFFVAAVSIAVYIIAAAEASGLQEQITSGNQELNQLTKKIGELSKIKEQKRIVEEKLAIINQLESDRTGPVRLLRNISEAIPQRAWVKTLRDKDYQISIEGYASDDEVVAEFMRGLERAGIGKVELEVAKRETEKESGSEVVSFVIRLEKEKPARETKADVKGKDKGKAAGRKPAAREKK